MTVLIILLIAVGLGAGVTGGVVWARSHRTTTAVVSKSTPAPTAAFTLQTARVPQPWAVSATASSYLNLADGKGCFTTSTLAAEQDYLDLSSVDSFKASYVKKFEQSGYTIDGITATKLRVNQSGTWSDVPAIAYVLSANGLVTYHVDAGVKGMNSTAFMSLACESNTGLNDAQAALLAVQYNDTYVPPADQKE